MDIIENEKNVQYFLDLIKKLRRGKFKLYIGMIAGPCPGQRQPPRPDR